MDPSPLRPPQVTPDEAEHRLAHDVVPVAQELRLELDPAREELCGSTVVRLDVKRPTERFRFHAAGLRLEAQRLCGARGEVRIALEAGRGSVVTATAASALAPGPWRLEMAFAGRLGDRASGLYRHRQGEHSYVFSQLQPDDARSVFPCWDEPCFKIPFQLTLVLPEGLEAVSNTPVASRRSRDGRSELTFAATRPMSSYLLAVAAGPLESVEVEGTSVPTAIWTLPGQSALAGQAARFTPKVLSGLEGYLGSPYPYEKLDLIAVPEFWPGGMENPGAVTFADRVLLLDPKSASPQQVRTMVSLLAHELAHMWFGGVVTMDWWDDLWLNEAFATWLGNKVAHQVLPEAGVPVEEVRHVQAAMAADSQPGVRAIRQRVQPGDNLLQSADALAYNKGRTVLEMFERFAGPATFRRGVVGYLRDRAWGVCRAEDLWDSLAKVAGRDLSAAMATFLEQPGVPLVEAHLEAGGKVRLRQRRFLNLEDGIDGAHEDAALWRIPVSIKYPVGERVRSRTLLLGKREQVLSLEGAENPGWVYPNAGESGYYRWAVASEVLVRLAERGPEVATVRERVGFTANAGALLGAGLLAGDRLLEIYRLLAGDPAPEVLAELTEGLGALRRLFAEGSEDSGFARYVRGLLRPALDRWGLEPTTGEAEAVARLRPRLLFWLGVDGRDEEARGHGAGLAREILAGRRTVEPALAGVALALLAEDGGGDLFETYRRRFEGVCVPAERQLFLGALGHFPQPSVARRALDYSLVGHLRAQEFLVLLHGVAARDALRDLLLDWIVEHYDALAGRLPPRFAAFLPRYAGGRNLERLARAEAFFSTVEERAPGTARELAKIAESVRHQAALHAREAAGVRAYLEGLEAP